MKNKSLEEPASDAGDPGPIEAINEALRATAQPLPCEPRSGDAPPRAGSVEDAIATALSFLLDARQRLEDDGQDDDNRVFDNVICAISHVRVVRDRYRAESRREAAQPVWHHMPKPGVAGCGADYPNMSKTDRATNVTCLDCLHNLVRDSAEASPVARPDFSKQCAAVHDRHGRCVFGANHTCDYHYANGTRWSAPRRERDQTRDTTTKTEAESEQGIRSAHAERDGEEEGDADRGSVRPAPQHIGASRRADVGPGPLPAGAGAGAREDEAGGGRVLRQEGDGERAGKQRVVARPAGEAGPAGPNASVEQARLESRVATVDAICRWFRDTDREVTAEEVWKQFRVTPDRLRAERAGLSPGEAARAEQILDSLPDLHLKSGFAEAVEIVATALADVRREAARSSWPACCPGVMFHSDDCPKKERDR